MVYEPNLFAGEHAGLWILFFIYFICMLFSFQQLLDTVKKSKLNRNLIKKGFLLFLTIFLFFRSILSVVPFPLNNTIAFVIVQQQFPRYLLFLSWQMLALWIGHAVSATNSSNTSRNACVIVSIVMYVVLFILLLVVSPILTYYEGGDFTSMEKPDHIPNAIAYAIVLISIGYYGGRLIYVLLSSTTHITKLHWRVRLLIVMVVITFCCFLIRFFWTIFDAFDLNVVQDAINDLVSDCRDECKWNEYYWIYFAYYFVTETLPPISLLVTFVLLSVQSSASSTAASASLNSASDDYTADNYPDVGYGRKKRRRDKERRKRRHGKEERRTKRRKDDYYEQSQPSTDELGAEDRALFGGQPAATQEQYVTQQSLFPGNSSIQQREGLYYSFG